MKIYCKFVIAIIFIVITVSVFVFFSKIQISESRYNKMLCYIIARNCTHDKNSEEQKILALQDFVHLNIHPLEGFENRSDTIAIDKLISGVGFCSQQSRVFMQLARSVGFNSRLIFLRLPNGSSPHTVAEVQLSNGRWVVVDTLYNLDLRNKNNELASIQDIKEDHTILSENYKIKLRKQYNKRWADSDFLSSYYIAPMCVIEKKGVAFDLLKFIPLSWIRLVDKYIANRYIDRLKRRINNMSELYMVKARTYHLIGYYKESELFYLEVLKTSNDKRLISKARYYLALLLKTQHSYIKSIAIINHAISTYTDDALKIYNIGLMCRILEENGYASEAMKKRKAIEFSLVA